MAIAKNPKIIKLEIMRGAEDKNTTIPVIKRLRISKYLIAFLRADPDINPLTNTRDPPENGL